jgi:methylglutaconyl-CoA hydratase
VAGAKLLVSQVSGVAVLTMNRPESRNALDTGLVAEMREALLKIPSLEAVRAVVLTGTGAAFCAGADLKQRQKMTQEESGRLLESVLECTNLLEALPVPVIAAINGPAYAGGLELALACDIRIAAREATLALTEIRLGVFPGAGGPFRLTSLVGKGWTKKLVLVGDPISAEEAFRIGLVEGLSTRDTVVEDALAIACRIAGWNPAAVRAAKVLIDRVPEMSRDTAQALSAALRHPLEGDARWAEGLKRQS